MAKPAASASLSDADVVASAARAHERDRYLSALLAPRPLRRDLIALAAYAGEIGRIPLYVDEPMMGRIRLEWWRERLRDGTSAGHPVAAAIIEAAARYNLPSAGLIGIIDAHDDSLDGPVTTTAAMLAHVDRIDGALFALASQIVGRPDQPELALNAGRAYGVARLVVESRAAFAHGRLLLPPVGETATEALSWPQYRDRIAPAAAIARGALRQCRPALRQLPYPFRIPFLPLALIEPYLQVLQNVRSDDAAADVNPLTRVWRLLRCRWTGAV